jgi:type II secretory pathway pseudopilin PulG
MTQKRSATHIQGLSVLELLLVLVVIAAIFFASVSRYQVYRRERNVAIIRENITLLYQALLLHYATNCKGNNYSVDMNSFSNPRTPNYEQYQALLNKLIYIPMAPNINRYQIGAERLTGTPISTPPAPPIYKLLVKVTLNIPIQHPATLVWYSQALGASADIMPDASVQFTVTRLPSSVTSNASNDPLWMQHQNLQYYKRLINVESTNIRCGF